MRGLWCHEYPGNEYKDGGTVVHAHKPAVRLQSWLNSFPLKRDKRMQANPRVETLHVVVGLFVEHRMKARVLSSSA